MNFYFLFLSNHQTWQGGDKWEESDAVLSLSLCKGIFITFSIIQKGVGGWGWGWDGVSVPLVAGFQVTSVKPSTHPLSRQFPKSLLCFDLHLAPKHTHYPSVSLHVLYMQCFEVDWVHARVRCLNFVKVTFCNSGMTRWAISCYSSSFCVLKIINSWHTPPSNLYHAHPSTRTYCCMNCSAVGRAGVRQIYWWKSACAETGNMMLKLTTIVTVSRWLRTWGGGLQYRQRTDGRRKKNKKTHKHEIQAKAGWLVRTYWMAEWRIRRVLTPRGQKQSTALWR